MPQSSGSAGFPQKAFTQQCVNRAQPLERRSLSGRPYDATRVHCKIGHPKCATTEFPEGAVFATCDLEIAEDQRG